MKEIIIGQNDAGQRLDKFLTKAVKRMPVSLMYKSIRTKKIKVNRKRATPEQMLEKGDVLQLFLSDDIFAEPGENKLPLEHIKPDFGIIYEDENIILCDKKPGMLAQPENGSAEGITLIDNVKAYLYKKGEYNPESEQSFAPALCNRIDRNTSGIVIAAKNAAALREMNDIIKVRDIEKKYLCAVHGLFENRDGVLKGFLTKDSKNNEVTVTKRREGADSKSIVTAYKVLKQRKEPELSLLEVELVTGRTHQIRAHFASVGHPLLGEGKYGVNREDRKLGYEHQALYSYSVKFLRNEGLFGYLCGKEFHADKSKIKFLELFDSQKGKNK